MNDQLAFIDILESEYSNFGLSIRKSKAYLFYYGKGYTEQCSGNFSQAIKWYLKSIVTWPLSAKPYIRIVQLALYKMNNKMQLVKNL